MIILWLNLDELQTMYVKQPIPIINGTNHSYIHAANIPWRVTPDGTLPDRLKSIHRGAELISYFKNESKEIENEIARIENEIARIRTSETINPVKQNLEHVLRWKFFVWLLFDFFEGVTF